MILQALAYNPNNNTENMTVSFDLRCHGGDGDGNGVRSVNPVVLLQTVCFLIISALSRIL